MILTSKRPEGELNADLVNSDLIDHGENHEIREHREHKGVHDQQARSETPVEFAGAACDPTYNFRTTH